jgi:hypothetical protein
MNLAKLVDVTPARSPALSAVEVAEAAGLDAIHPRGDGDARGTIRRPLTRRDPTLYSTLSATEVIDLLQAALRKVPGRTATKWRKRWLHWDRKAMTVHLTSDQ